MVYDGILMETIGIPVMVSIGLLLFFFLLAGTSISINVCWMQSLSLRLFLNENIFQQM